jgi:protocatechuate 3,4-dioxygenase beta subunit
VHARHRRREKIVNAATPGDPRDTALTTLTQRDITDEIRQIEADAAALVAAGGSPEIHPRRDYPPYRSSMLRHPTHQLVRVDP